MNDIQYFDIVKQALRMTWDNKFLWVFGLLIFLGSLSSDMNMDFSKISAKNSQLQSASAFIHNYPSISLGLGLAGIAVFVALVLLKVIATAGLIKSTNNIAVYKQFPIFSILSEVKKYIWQLLGLEIIITVALGIIFILMFVPIAYLFALKANVLSIISVGIAFLIFIPLVIIAYYLRKFAYFYIILGNMNIRMALEAAYSLLRKNVEKSLVMGIVNIISCMGVMATATVSMMILAAVCIPLGLVLYFMFAKTGIIIVSIFGAAAGVLILLAIFSWYVSFAQTLWVLFFQQISLEKQQQEKKMAEKIETEMKVPSPEAV